MVNLSMYEVLPRCSSFPGQMMGKVMVGKETVQQRSNFHFMEEHACERSFSNVKLTRDGWLLGVTAPGKSRLLKGIGRMRSLNLAQDCFGDISCSFSLRHALLVVCIGMHWSFSFPLVEMLSQWGCWSMGALHHHRLHGSWFLTNHVFARSWQQLVQQMSSE